jgi:hypothetical protein
LRHTQRRIQALASNNLQRRRPAVRDHDATRAVSCALVIEMDTTTQENQAVAAAADRAALEALLATLTPTQITQLTAVVHALGVCNAQREVTR